MTDESWITIGRITDIPRRGARCVVTPLGRLAVFRTADDQVFATEDRCPHKGGPLSQGIVHDGSVTCPLHHQVIDLSSGCVRGPDVGRVTTYPVRVDPASEAIELCLVAIPVLAEAAE